jgi:ubiquitin carboxyl-terminal hydrolase 5/13
MSVPVSKSLAINKEQVAAYEKRKAEVEASGQRLEPGDIVRPEIRLEDCLSLFTQQEIIDDFYSSAVKTRVNAIKTTGFGTFPQYLLIQAKKFEHAVDWSPIKLDVSLQVPETLDITSLRSEGLKQGEVELSDEVAAEIAAAAAASQLPTIALNENVIQQLVDMGFSREGSRRAAYHTRDANDAEAAVNWCMAHMEDDDFNAPFEMPNSRPAAVASKAAKVYDEEKIDSIVPLGFSRAQAIKALEATGMNVERAVDWIFNHPDELMDTNEAEDNSQTNSAASSSNNTPASTYKDGSGVYRLVGFISHMGTNANVGHYVAHLFKNGKWTIFNDENVALSENPPKDLAYLYLYQRV